MIENVILFLAGYIDCKRTMSGWGTGAKFSHITGPFYHWGYSAYYQASLIQRAERGF